MIRLKNLSPIIWFFMLVTISGISITRESYDVVKGLRGLLVLVNILFALRFLVFDRVVKTAFVPIIVCFIFFFWSNYLALLNGVVNNQWSQGLADFGLTVIGIIMFSELHRRQIFIICKKSIPWFSFYGLGGAVLIYYYNGLVFDPIPKFLFSLDENASSANDSYSLTLTSFFATPAVCSVVGIYQKHSALTSVFSSLATIILMGLAILAGGRGEIISGVIVIAFSILWFSRKRFGVMILVALAIITGLFSIKNLDLSDFLVTERFLNMLDGDYSYRDVLLRQVLEIVMSDPGILILGRGTGYFQWYFGYDFGLYPHNHIAEGVIIFGVPLMLVYFYLALQGALKYYRRVGEIDIFLLVVFFSAILSLKSGYFLGNWVVNAACFFFVGITLQRRDTARS